MFRSKTLFVLGAGASCEFGLPDGTELKREIAKLLDIRFRNFSERISGDGLIVEALRRHVANNGGRDINPYLQAGRRISGALPQALSVDNYLDAHRNDKEIQLSGKLGIVRAILKAERQSKLYVDLTSRRFDVSKTGGSWLEGFIQLLTEGVAKEDVSSIFENISIVNFNYDRCLQHFLPYALSNYYGLNESEARALTRSLNIIHPYGVVGDLKWRDEGGSGVIFGDTEYGVDLVSLAGGIKTFTERVDDQIILNEIRTQIESAETIVFLGFGFHHQNLSLLGPPTHRPPKAALEIPPTTRVFATIHGISQSDWNVIQHEISTLLSFDGNAVEIEPAKMRCSELFHTYRRSLSR